MQLIQRYFMAVLLLPVILLMVSCTAGGDQFATDSPAGFWYGLWHGAISIISLVIHIFNSEVMIYEVNNTGGWYDFGFLFGVLFIWGGSSHVCCRSSEEKLRDKEWEEIGEKVEIKVMRKLKDWADDEDATDKDQEWDEIGKKVEKKLKRKIREWAEKE